MPNEPFKKFQWPKGKSGNPSGREKLPEHLREFKQTTYREFLTSLQLYGSMNDAELVTELARPELSQFQRMFGNIVQEAVAGNYISRQLLIDRLWGKLKDHDVHVNLQAMSTEELIEMGKRALQVLQPTIQIEAGTEQNAEHSGNDKRDDSGTNERTEGTPDGTPGL